ncbi:MAG: Pr6Pr family membrane protein [Promethearchaeota archaeon]|jgi:hypothetical protein
MKNLTISNKTILIYRIIFAALSWFTIITSISLNAFTSGSILLPFNVFKSLTYQTNLIVTIWLTLAIIWHNKPETIEKFLRPLKGAFTIYITLTFVLYALLLQIFSRATGFAAFNSVVLHYITPIAFIIDWILTETELRYKWNYLAYWIIYPICYLVFTFIHGTITGNYIYYVLDISTLGILVYFMFISVLILIYLILGSLYIVVNRRRTKD